MISFVAALLLCAALVGCGNQGAGVSTGSQSTKEVGQASQVEHTKTVSAENRVTAVVTVPIAPLIGEAWGELLRFEKPPEQAQCENLWRRPTSAMMAVQENETLALQCAFKLGYQYAFMPTMGWPVKPESEQGGSYRLRALAHVLHVNNLASDIAAQVTTTSYKDPDEAKTAIKELLREQRSYLLQVYLSSLDLHLLSGSFDLSGVKDVMFSKGAYHMTLGAGGAVIKYSGVDWFGNGNLSGKRYELQLASMTGVAMSRGRTVTEGSQKKVATDTKAQTGVGR